jgi:hypothetical protein
MSTIGHSASIPSWGASTPPSGTQRIYVDGTAGLDTNSGVDWANAFQTLRRAEIAARAILSELPDGVDVIIYVRGAFATYEVLDLNDCLSGLSRVYVVHPFDQWTISGAGADTGALVALPGAPGDEAHNLQAVQPAFVVNGTMLGHVLRFEENDGIATDTALATIVQVDAVQNYLLITRESGAPFPAWVAPGTCNLSVLEPTMTGGSNLTVVLGGCAADPTTTGAAPVQKRSWVVGMRDTLVVAQGPWCGAVGLFAGNVTADGDYFAGCYARDGWGNVFPGLSDALAQEFGIYTGAGFVGFDHYLGSSVQSMTLRGNEAFVAGYFSQQVNIAGGQGSRMLYWRAPSVEASAPCTVSVDHGIVVPDGNVYALVASADGANMTVGNVGYEAAVGGGGTPFLFATMGGVVNLSASGVPLSTRYCDPAALPSSIAYAMSGGEVNCNGLLGTTLLARTNFVRCEFDAVVRLAGFNGAANISAQPGGGSDILVRYGGRLLVGSAIVKNAVNTSVGGYVARPVLEVGYGGRVFAIRDGFAPGTLTLPAGSGDHTADYGAYGAIRIYQNSDVQMGPMSGGGGASVGVACTIRHGSKFCHAGAGISGLLPMQLGGLPVQAWPAVVTTDPAELAMVLPNAA